MNQTETNYDKNTLLRFFTAGSVDDGKSTLIGRLLYDTKNILANQYETLKEVSERRGRENVDLALLTDGLRAEREQGITIDVAYRYFSTPNRKFIIADTPGHVQYTYGNPAPPMWRCCWLMCVMAPKNKLIATSIFRICSELEQLWYVLIKWIW